MEGFEFRQLSPENGVAEYEMLQDIGANENGFTNEVYGMIFEQYKEWLIRQDDYSKSRNLPENFIPKTTYFLYMDKKPVGIARIRYFSADFLESRGGGNFGYAIARTYRGRGYGKILFANVLEKCRLLGYCKARSFVDVGNVASNKIFVSNGAVLTGVFNGVKNIYEMDVG